MVNQVNILKKRAIARGLWHDRKFINNLQRVRASDDFNSVDHIIKNMINARKDKMRLWQKELKTCL
jgi:hypothetical protein